MGILVLGGIPKGSGQLHTLSTLALWPPSNHSATKFLAWHVLHRQACPGFPNGPMLMAGARGASHGLIPATSFQPRLDVRRQRRATPSGAAALETGLSRQPIRAGVPQIGGANGAMIIQRNSAQHALPGAPTGQRAGCTNAPASLSAILERG